MKDFKNKPSSSAFGRDNVDEPRKSRKTRWGQSVSSSKTTNQKSTEPPVSENQLTETQKHKSETGNITTKTDLETKPANVAISATAAKAAIEKAKKALALQKQVQEQLKNLKAAAANRAAPQNNAVAAVVRLNPSSKPLRFDRLGREIDAEGKVLDVKPIARSTLKVNINKERERKLKQATFNTRIDRSLTNPALNKWFDPTLPANSKLRKRGLSFVEKGYYANKEKMLQSRELAKSLGLKVLTPELKKEQKLREAAAEMVFNKIKEMQADSEGLLDVQNDDDENINPNFISLGERKPTVIDAEAEDFEDTQEWSSHRQEALHSLQRKQVGIIPDIEWWDQPLLKKASELDDDAETSDFPYVINTSVINDYVEHPVPIEPVVDLAKPVPPTLYLTAKEQKKLRRRKRQEKEREKRDKIRMGLIPPPPPTVRLSNLARVLGKEAAAEPSRIEKEVLKQVEKRKKDHEERNKARKLDAEARRKNTSKWTKMPHESEVPAGGAEVRLFAVSCLTNSAHLYKVDKNAQQYHVTGACILCPQIGNMIVVEGSAKALKKYTNLLLRRIKWHLTSDESTTKPFENTVTETLKGNPEDSSAYCRLLWQGVVKTRCFKQWRIYPCKSESEIKKVLVDRNADFYWDMFQKLHVFDNSGF